MLIIVFFPMFISPSIDDLSNVVFLFNINVIVDRM